MLSAENALVLPMRIPFYQLVLAFSEGSLEVFYARMQGKHVVLFSS